EDICFITNENFGILKITDRGIDKALQKEEFPGIETLLNKGYEQIYSKDKRHVFFASEEGIIHFDYKKMTEKDSAFNALIREVKLRTEDDSIIFGGAYSSDTSYSIMYREKLSSDQNALGFSFASSDFLLPHMVEYRYRLKGFDANWSSWNKIKSKEYTNLPPGNYQFIVEARDASKQISKPSSFSFEIAAPWYASQMAFGIYILLLIACFYTFFGYQQKKIKNLQKDHSEVVVASEKKIGQLKEEQIQQDLAFKERELVSATMHILQKNELLEKVNTELRNLRKRDRENPLSKDINRLIKMLEQDKNLDRGWEQFLMHFNEVNKDFFSRLKASYPGLTPKDLKLCAYLRMNLSTKEMASLLNVTVRGIEASRYRLRKKFELDSSENLTEFLMAY
ncbi:MAG: triple tyrosine motif-containing protein, partial [Bacteroidota bacterium]